MATDNTSPTMTITSTTVTSGSKTNDPSIDLTFTASELTADFDVNDISYTNGSLSSLPNDSLPNVTIPGFEVTVTDSNYDSDPSSWAGYLSMTYYDRKEINLSGEKFTLGNKKYGALWVEGNNRIVFDDLQQVEWVETLDKFKATPMICYMWDTGPIISNPGDISYTIIDNQVILKIESSEYQTGNQISTRKCKVTLNLDGHDEPGNIRFDYG